MSSPALNALKEVTPRHPEHDWLDRQASRQPAHVCGPTTIGIDYATPHTIRSAS
jgi:hypothetical protein